MSVGGGFDLEPLRLHLLLVWHKKGAPRLSLQQD